MIVIDKYHVTELIYESRNSHVYRGVREVDQCPVILKVLQGEYPTPQQLANYRHEFEITRGLSISGVIQAYELSIYRNSLVMVIEDCGGQSLKALGLSGCLSLSEFLRIAIQLSTIVDNVHQCHVIHKDINPANIVFNPTTQVMKLIDFGISTRLSHEYTSFRSPTILEGTLAYISPEQTGRMNRVIDYRTDLYSLGVTFYELLTGKLPFAEDDPLALVHSHIAKTPSYPDFGSLKGVESLSHQTISAVSQIIMKLLAKNAEDRYQSAFGVQYDLEQCADSLTHTNIWGTGEFQIAKRDFSGSFQIPQKLYGREAEIETLLAAFERMVDTPPADRQAEIILVAGYSGIGKSALVHEIHKPITMRRGYFVSGKYDQFQRNVPYYAIIYALRDLMRQLLTETQAQLDDWKKQVLTALGSNGQVIIEVIPEVEMIIGSQPAVPELGPTESQNRFNLVFQNFIRVFCQPEHSLVIFLDDLQWIDSASLKLMTLMNDIPYLLLIGAYRDNEVSGSHPLMITLEDMQQQQGIIVQTLTLTPLALPHMNQVVSDTLHLQLAKTLPLAELLLEKTGGNPFFMKEFFKTLYTEALLQFNPSQREWYWDLDQIQARNISDNVVELMTDKIQRLPVSTQTILKLAAIVGNQFDLAILSVISQTPFEQVKSDLWEALAAG
ncbi:MAG: serine/threonine-protein kinase PknK, partial [Desulfobacterales bacterium]|nr:serine/threonine-protein kinase PknK [Desulfobacterales bacterium]